MQSVNVRGLYPAGEGASYAGGILSAGVDGIRVAEALARQMLTTSTDVRLASDRLQSLTQKIETK